MWLLVIIIGRLLYFIKIPFPGDVPSYSNKATVKGHII